jgi:hypothetical protein
MLNGKIVYEMNSRVEHKVNWLGDITFVSIFIGTDLFHSEGILGEQVRVWMISQAEGILLYVFEWAMYLYGTEMITSLSF